MLCNLRLILTGSSARLSDQLLVPLFLNAAFSAIGQKAAPCQKGMGELLGLLQAGWSPPSANAPGLPRAPSGVVGIPRTPTGKPILFGTCAPHQGASASLSPDVFRRLSVAAFAGLFRYHRSPSVVFCSLPALLQSLILTG